MNNSVEEILHVTDLRTLNAVDAGQYQCESLQNEGFIHCCTSGQLAGVLERYYQGVTGLQLMRINPEKLTAKLVFENTVGGEELFPHIYGVINMDAVETIEAIE